MDDLFAGPNAERAKHRAAMAGEAIGSLTRRHERGVRSLQFSAGRGDQTG